MENNIFPNLTESIHRSYLADEEETVAGLLTRAQMDETEVLRTQALATELVQSVRSRLAAASGMHALLRYYDLSSEEGIVLMCLAEALLRIPDDDTVDALIADKLGSGNWHKHLGKSDSLFVNASTWALMLTGRLFKSEQLPTKDPDSLLESLLNRLEEPVVRAAIRHAMRVIAEQFVMGSNIDKALARADLPANHGYCYSYDMLGEAALTEQDACFYQQAYLDAISAIGQRVDQSLPLPQRPGVSVKLSALFARYEFSQQERAVKVLSERLLALAVRARQAGISLTVDAEEAERLALSLRIFATVYVNPALAGWSGLGLAVQAYQKRALPVLEFINDLATRKGQTIPVRLVKGAYWDTEIKRAQQQGLSDYPVFTRKNNTDVSYLACARFLLSKCGNLYPQFATHNAYTVAAILRQGAGRDYEFQRLHGMGEELYAQVLEANEFQVPCRVYAPVGAHQDLLPYLVRRLLENGANSSFVNQLAHPDQPIDELVIDPVAMARALTGRLRHPDIPLPADLFADQRLNSKGVNFADECELEALLGAVKSQLGSAFESAPVIAGQRVAGIAVAIKNPANCDEVVGTSISLQEAQNGDIRRALDVASQHWLDWETRCVSERAGLLLKAAELFEQHQAELIALCVSEAGKTLKDSQAEVREAIDLLRYYAHMAQTTFAQAQQLPGFTGETNELSLHGRGVFVCISPWNFPLAIFTGQIAAALVTGNCVLAKPASATCLVAGRVIELLYGAGVPTSVLHFLPCEAQLLSTMLLADERIAGVAFTGSTQTARQINQTLAQRAGPIAVLIAETGGQNAMLVDSSAQPEQVVLDVVQSAFNSAGQRCSALRVLYLQEEIAPRIMALIKGHMEELVIGDPLDLRTDIGPLISAVAKQALEAHIAGWGKQGRVRYRCDLPQSCLSGYFVAPTVIEIDAIEQLAQENFGAVLHVVRYAADQLDDVLDAINATGYGLTFGLHSRIAQRTDIIRQRVRAGNLYVNRDTIGAVVGVQPFGGNRLSGTGPKAGGPNYLLRFATEQTCTINTSAAGGNALLLRQVK